MHPYLSIQVGSERRREMLANAEQQRLARQLRAFRRASRRAGRAEQRMHRAVRRPLRPRTELEP